MKTYITSDLHFCHKSILNFCPESRARYPDVETMTEMMIQEWNEIIHPTDKVYILGDVAFCNAEEAATIVNQLNGVKVLVAGNHDTKLLKNEYFRKCFAEIHNYLEISYNGTHVVLCHYPFREWNRMHRGSINFHGHLHGSPSGMEEFRSMDVGMDATGKIVVSMEDAISKALNGKIKGHHDKY